MNLARILSIAVYALFGVLLLIDFGWLLSIDTENEIEVGELADFMLQQGLYIGVVGAVLMIVVPIARMVIDLVMHGEWQPIAKAGAFIVGTLILYYVGVGQATGTNHYDVQEPDVLIVGEALSQRIGGVIIMGYILLMLAVAGIVINGVIALIHSFGSK